MADAEKKSAPSGDKADKSTPSAAGAPASSAAAAPPPPALEALEEDDDFEEFKEEDWLEPTDASLAAIEQWAEDWDDVRVHPARLANRQESRVT